MPPATVADTWVLVPVRRLCRPLAASNVVGPSSRAPRISVRVGGVGTSRETAVRCWLGATRKIGSGTPTVWGMVDPTVAGGAGLSRWTGRFSLAMGVGALAVGIPHAAAVTIRAVVATTARRLPTRRLTTGAI